MSAAAVALGTFAVGGTADEAEAFRAAIGLPADVASATLPLTFSMRWLVTAAVRASLAAMVPEPDLVLVHESQAFDYVAPLRVGARYTMSLAARRRTDPDQLVVDGTIATEDGATVATLETILRLFSANPVSAGTAAA